MSKDFSYIETVLDPELQIADVRGALAKTAEYFLREKPTSIKFLGWSFEKVMGQARRTNLTVEYGYGNSQWVLVTAQLRGEPGEFRIWGFHVQKLPKSLSELNAFTFSGKGWIHCFFIFAMALAFGITVYALMLCVRTAGLRRKWLWVLFILFGVCAFSLNWTTGEFKVAVLHFNLFSAAAMRSGFAGPWILTYCVPVGAMVFLSKRRGMAALQVKTAEANQTADPTPSSDAPAAGQPPHQT